MRFHKALTIGVLASSFLVADIRIDGVGNPAYAPGVQQNADGSAFYAHTDEWAAIWFIRDPGCVPTDFNLLLTDDFVPAFPGGPPRPFLCAPTVSEFSIWKNGPPPIDSVPILVSDHGLGAVPVWFVRLAEIQAAAADGNLTITEILAMPSLRKGVASQFESLQQPGAYRPQGAGNGSIQATASGVLQDGTPFLFEFREMGVKDGGGVSYVRNVRIEFK